MELWFTEKHTKTRGLSFQISKTLHHEESPFQVMDIVETPDFGRVMLLDDVVMVTDVDEFVYHEMITHVPLFSHPNPKHVLIIGGGDGGTLREVCKHHLVQTATLIEIDSMVIEGAKAYFPRIAEGFKSPKAQVIVDDGIKFLKECKTKYDVILIDSTDPVGPATGLFRSEFYQDCFNALNDDGILTVQSESPYIPDLVPIIRDMNQNLSAIFPIVRMYLASIQTYQAGLWSFQIASKRYDPIMDFQESVYLNDGLQLQYYNKELHRACFALPEFVLNIIK
ncbi:MAG TPA: polyamine aminopropyltransferase [Candidatus Cloacimonadota bacterium]|nr:polyamine aminopropyltransferase [Candidatus Cloacimonadota bacterium]HPT71713.1 polyamine aminopropyltransferase [Candidatus Cloacimonadota bacterium]